MDAIVALVSANIRSAMARRAAFLLRMSMMCINNFLFFLTWVVLYTQVPSLNGWTYNDMKLLFAISTTAFGVGIFLFSGFMQLPYLVRTGGLDAMMMKPVSVLIQAITSRPEASALGDAISGVIFFFLSGYCSLEGAVWFVVGSLLGAVTFVSFGVITHSIGFWISDFDEMAGRFFEFLITASLYPESIYPTSSRFVFYTLIPAGFVVFVPVVLVKTFAIEYVLLLSVGSFGFAALAYWIFYRGLSRYESGNRWTWHGA